MTRSYSPAYADSQQSIATLVSHTASTAFQSVVPVLPPYAGQLRARHGGKLLQPKPHRSKYLFGAMASIVSFVTILTLLTLCRTSQIKLSSVVGVRRNLSDTEDDEERSYVLEQCLDLEEELGLGLANSPHGEDVIKAKARLADALYESAMDFERMRALPLQRLQGDLELPPPKIPRFNEAWPSIPHLQAYAGAFLPDPSRVAPDGAAYSFHLDTFPTTVSGQIGEIKQQQQIAKVDETPVFQELLLASGPRRQPFYQAEIAAGLRSSFAFGQPTRFEDALAPDAWLGDPLERKYPQPCPQTADNNVWQSPTVAAPPAAFTNAGPLQTYNELAGMVDRKRAHEHGAQGVAVPSAQMKTVRQLEHKTQLFDLTLNSLEKATSAAAVWAASSGSGEPCGAGDIRLHPFVRLPVVNPEDVNRSFREEFALSLHFGRSSPMESYTTMRVLFAKTSLTAQDVETLLTEAELLANYATDKLARPYRRCTANYLVMKLSSLLMVFDYLVCTMEILGDKMNTGRWWTEFVQKFRTEFCLPESARTQRGNILNKLVNRLSSALSVYKSGRRPSFREIIELKRTILTSPYKGSQLSHPLWKLWIQDDKEFFCTSDDFVSYSDIEASGTRKSKEP